MQIEAVKLAGSRRVAAPKRPPGALDVPVLTAIMAGVLYYAWTLRSERHLTAETGAGYYLGIIGGVMMLLLLVYPLRKRTRALRWVGSVPGWFRIHMFFGVVGPSLVLLHSNFRLGSLNSRVALFSMLLVAGSGYVGRFLYQRIHRGLNGRRRAAGELREQVKALWGPLVGQDEGQRIAERLGAFERRYLSTNRSLLVALALQVYGRKPRADLRREILSLSKHGPHLSQDLDAYLSAARHAQAFVIYERLFSLWHFLHLPFFMLLVGTALLHVFAVHLY